MKNFWFIDEDNDETYSTLYDLKSHVRGLCKEDLDKMDGMTAVHFKNNETISTVDISVKNNKAVFGKTTKNR